MHDHHMRALADARLASQRARIAAIAAGIRRRGRAVRSALDRIIIRGQLGPSVGYPHDRFPEPPF